MKIGKNKKIEEKKLEQKKKNNTIDKNMFKLKIKRNSLKIIVKIIKIIKLN